MGKIIKIIELTHKEIAVVSAGSPLADYGNYIAKKALCSGFNFSYIIPVVSILVALFLADYTTDILMAKFPSLLNLEIPGITKKTQNDNDNEL